mmetsp:Transcript_5926/g.17739  ORF Transcript_5926/g.17739 Transcript_5926/m.17739 type:complete len:505 (-) Transcript_5926:652-2166(-)
MNVGMWTVGTVAVLAAVASAQPSIVADSFGNLTIQIPVGATATVQYINTAGQVVASSPLVTRADLDAVQANLTQMSAASTELLGRQIQALNASKQNVADAATAYNVLQGEITNALTSIGQLQLQSNDTSALAQAQANCHTQGRIYNQTSGQCDLALTVSCGTTFTPGGGNRVSGNCGGAHFFGDRCSAVCAPGYTGAPQLFQCHIDGMWRPTAAAASCLDVNECANASTCNAQQVCTNFPGGYTCRCRPGFQPLNGVCQVVNTTPTRFTIQYGGSIFGQAYTVPAGITSVNIAVWGSGGGNAYGNTGGYGAFAEGTFSVVPGQRLTVAVGGPGIGYRQPPNGTITRNYQHPPGGGLCGVFNGSRISQATALVVAGSGGGAGSNQATSGGNAGNLIGQSGQGRPAASACQGVGAGARAGGTPAGTADIRGSGGGALLGGTAGSYGGGGGAGFWGGGGGGHCPGVCGCGGGGGNSYVAPSATGAVVRPRQGSVGGNAGYATITPIV